MRAKAKAKKEPLTAATVGGSGSLDGTSSTVNSTTDTSQNQDILAIDGDAKGRHFWYVVYPTEEYFHSLHPEGTYDGSNGWGTMTESWINDLAGTGLAFEVSELHWLDVTPSGMQKKPHWHVIVTWPNTTTYRAACGLGKMLNCPKPLLLHNVIGAHRYHRHLDNPEKHQYQTYGTAYNGWTAPLQADEVTRIKREIKELILVEDIQEYAELLIVCETKGVDYLDVAMNNTLYCERICASYRNNPMRVLLRYFNVLPDGDLKDEIGKRIDVMSGGNRQ